MSPVARWIAVTTMACIAATIETPDVRAQQSELGFSLPSSAEELGHWPVASFRPADYDGHPQTWDTAQDDRGVLYVATTDGVLVYDGETWEEIVVGDGVPVVDLAISADGRVCVGGLAEFGCLAPDSTGRLRYRSRVDALPDSIRSDLGDVYKVHASSEAVYYQTTDRIIRQRADGTTDIWNPDGSLFLSSLVRDTLYVHEAGRGLLRLVDDEVEVVPGTARLRDNSNHFVVAHPDGGLVFSTYTDGLFYIDGRGARPFRTEVDSVLTSAKPYHAAVLPNDWIAIGTLLEGVFILSPEGELVRRINAENQLHTNGVNRVVTGREGGLWLNTMDGLAYVDLASPFTYFDADDGLEAPTSSFLRHAGTPYASTGQGVYALQRSQAGMETWTRVIYPQPCGSMISTDRGLLVACDAGVYQIQDEQVALVYSTIQSPVDEGAEHLLRDPTSDDWLWVGTRTRLVALRWRSGTWTEEHRIDNLAQGVDSYAWQNDHELWAATFTEGVVRIRLKSDRSVADVRTSAEADGIPASRPVVARVDGRVVFGTPEGLFRLRSHRQDSATVPVRVEGGRTRRGREPRRFEPDSTFGPTLLSTHVHAISQGPTGDVWAVLENRVGRVRRATPRPSTSTAKEKVAVHTEQWYPFPPEFMRAESVSDVYPEIGGLAWMSGPNGVVRFHPPAVPSVRPKRKALVRQVSVIAPANPAQDSVLYAGGVAPDLEPPVLDPPHDDLRFRYALAAHSGAGETRYRYQLAGYEGRWSPWTDETVKDYTNLASGTYTFRVQARGPDGQLSDVGTYGVQLLPPWYQTGWALALFAVLGAALVGVTGQALYRYRTYRLRQRNRVLQDLVREKTKGLRREQERLERTNRELKRTNEKQNELLGVAAHDLKNPIYGIIGTSKLLLDKINDPEFEASAQKFLPLVQSTAEQMHALVHGLLDAHIVEAGEIELQRTECNLSALTEAVLRWNRPRAEDKDIALELDAPKACAADVDETHIQRVVDNLVSNAVKFSPPGSSVRVTVRCEDAWAEVRVADDGPGLTEADRKHLFEKLARLSATPTAGESSTGIGLHISKQLVDRHHGELYAESQPGKGATFVMRVPREPSG